MKENRSGARNKKWEGEEGEKKKLDKAHKPSLWKKGGRREGSLWNRRAGGCRGYPEGTNCSGVRQGVLPAHILPTHQEPDTHTPSGLALSVWTALPTVFSPPPPLINPQYPRNPRRPNLESVYSDNPDANFALLPPSPSIILACQRHGMTELSTQRLSAHHSTQRFKNIWKPWTVWEYLYSSETLAQNQSGCCIMLGAGSGEEIVFHEQALARRTFVLQFFHSQRWSGGFSRHMYHLQLMSGIFFYSAHNLCCVPSSSHVFCFVSNACCLGRSTSKAHC